MCSVSLWNITGSNIGVCTGHPSEAVNVSYVSFVPFEIALRDDLPAPLSTKNTTFDLVPPSILRVPSRPS